MCSVNSLIISNSYRQSGNLLICRKKALLSVLMLFVNHKLFSVFLHLDHYTCDFYLTQLNIPSALFLFVLKAVVLLPVVSFILPSFLLPSSNFLARWHTLVLCFRYDLYVLYLCLIHYTPFHLERFRS